VKPTSRITQAVMTVIAIAPSGDRFPASPIAPRDGAGPDFETALRVCGRSIERLILKDILKDKERNRPCEQWQ
jgi:hypothetical protein